MPHEVSELSFLITGSPFMSRLLYSQRETWHFTPKNYISATTIASWIATIDTPLQSCIHRASFRQMHNEKLPQTSEIGGKRQRKSTPRLSKKQPFLGVDELQSSFFYESMALFFLVLSFTEYFLAIQVTIATENGRSLCSNGLWPLNRSQNKRIFLNWSTSNNGSDII